jgi:hypothetical protein
MTSVHYAAETPSAAVTFWTSPARHASDPDVSPRRAGDPIEWVVQGRSLRLIDDVMMSADANRRVTVPFVGADIVGQQVGWER